MTVQVRCSNCGKVLVAKDEYAGRNVKCPRCQTRNRLPVKPGASSPPEIAAPAHSPARLCVVCGNSFDTDGDQVQGSHGRLYHRRCYEQEQSWRRAMQQPSPFPLDAVGLSAPGSLSPSPPRGSQDDLWSQFEAELPPGLPPGPLLSRPRRTRSTRKTYLLIGIGGAVPLLVLLAILVRSFTRPATALTGGEAGERTAVTKAEFQRAGEKTAVAAAGLQPSVAWTFRPGSSGFAATPNEWTTKVALKNSGSKTWVVLPDVVFAEHSGGEGLVTAALGGAIQDSSSVGLCPEALNRHRHPGVPFRCFNLPKDKSGSRTAFWLFSNSITIGNAAAHWTVNGQEALWEPTEIKEGDQFKCEWEVKCGATFTKEVKSKADYGIFHIGPVCYPRDDPTAPACVLVAVAQQPGAEKYEKRCDRPQFIPLTEASIQSEIDDVAKPLAWRAQFLVLAWDQPRAGPSVDGILMEVLQNEVKYPLVLRKGACWGLVRRQYAPGRPVLLSLVCNRQSPSQLRCTILSALDDQLAQDEISRMTGIAKDKTEAADVRAELLRCMRRLPQAELLVAVAKDTSDDKKVRNAAVDALAAKELTDPVYTIMQDKTDDIGVRSNALRKAAEHKRFDVISAIALDRDNPDELRKLALEQYSKQGRDADLQVFESLKDDRVLGTKIRELLRQREKSMSTR